MVDIYTGDMILLGNTIEQTIETILDMLSILGKLKERDLMLNVDKTKVVIFNKPGKEKKENWIWKGKRLKEVKDFKYLDLRLIKQIITQTTYKGNE